MSEKAPLNLFGIPYDLTETFRWIIKHLIYDLFYPITLGLFILFFIKEIPSYWILFLICVSTISLGCFLFYWIQSVRNKEKNTGIYNEEYKWNVDKLNDFDEKNVIFEIGFVGDIMKMKKYRIEFDDSIKSFFNGVNLIAGNLEGMINDKKTLNILRQKHNSNILVDLSNITEPSPEWLLCISNNHSADYKLKWFNETLNIIDKKDGFRVFGKIGNLQQYQPRKDINIVSGTMWNNYKNNFASQFREINNFYEDTSFNILYPHWHFENECYVREKVVKKCKSLFTTGEYDTTHKFIPKKFRRKAINTYDKNPKWDLIFGHHTHVPQPIVVVPNSVTHKNNLLSYSGGNFTSSKRIAKHQHGLILRCQIGKINTTNNDASFAVRRIDWSYTKCKRDKKKKIVHIGIDEEHNKKKSYDFRETKILKNLFVVSILYLSITPIISVLVEELNLLDVFMIFVLAISVIGIQFFVVWIISRLFFKYKK